MDDLLTLTYVPAPGRVDGPPPALVDGVDGPAVLQVADPAEVPSGREPYYLHSRSK